ncbi:MAG TPA: carbon-nitrogen hydrolase family protein [Candidatus Krumholzibacteria bacterium]|nr:carbon-nitrogen hydrolase family protein [Candidatus Krumholzibacteria bacterium]
MGVAQTIPIRGDVGANVEHHVRLVHAAAEERTQVLVFPELSLTGYEIELARELAFAEDDPRLSPLIDAASSCAMTLIVGAPITAGSSLHIGAFIITPDRAIDLYTKHHLGAFSAGASCDGVVPPAEATVFQPGDRNPLVRFGDGTAAVAVCADTGRSSHPQAAADRGVSTYLASMFVIPSEFEDETANLGPTPHSTPWRSRSRTTADPPEDSLPPGAARSGPRGASRSRDSMQTAPA